MRILRGVDPQPSEEQALGQWAQNILRDEAFDRLLRVTEARILSELEGHALLAMEIRGRLLGVRELEQTLRAWKSRVKSEA